MDVKDRLPRFAIRVEDRAIAFVCNVSFPGNGRRPARQFSHQLIVTWLEDIQRFDVSFRHNQHMSWGLRIDVVESNHPIVFVDDGRRNFTRDDSAEEAAHNGLWAVGFWLSVSFTLSVCQSRFEQFPAGRV